jgi:hypothetical protein
MPRKVWIDLTWISCCPGVAPGPFGRFGRSPKTRKPALQAGFRPIAGAGFEPATFGL